MAPHETALAYYRSGRLLRFGLSSTLTDGELREIVTGLWARLGDDDRVEVLQNLLLLHTEPEEYINTLASAVARGLIGDQVVSLDAVAPMFHAELPGVR